MIDRFLPSDRVIGRQAECCQRVARCTAIAKNARARLAADGNGLMPLNGIEVIGDRGGHVFSSGMTLHANNQLGAHARCDKRQAADTQSAGTSLRETVVRDVWIEG